jgi:hypothetical protein
VEHLKEEVKKVLDSKFLVRILKIIVVFIVVILIFSAGVTVGFHKATFGRDWGEHYNENFGMGHQGGPTGGMDDFPNAHGAIGKILKIELPNIIVEDRDNTEKAILVGNDTQIQEGSNTLTSTDLKIGDFAVVIGTPDPQGVIEAKLIRILPNPESLK